jgi:hypothetical protein
VATSNEQLHFIREPNDKLIPPTLGDESDYVRPTPGVGRVRLNFLDSRKANFQTKKIAGSKPLVRNMRNIDWKEQYGTKNIREL